MGRRIQRSKSAGGSTNYVYDGADVVKDINSDNSTVEYLNGLGIDDKLRQTSSAGTLYFSKDHLGSTRALTDTSGNVVESISYDSFGNGASNLTRYGYTGREWDSDANLYYYRNRWYDPQEGRFISEDPVGFKGGMNWYSYVGNDSLRWRDPQGLWPSWGHWPFGGHVHQASAERVLGSRLTPEQLYWLQKGLYDADWAAGNQDEDESPRHAMTPGNGDPVEARKEANRLFKTYIDEAQRDFSVYQLEAMYKLGYAMHILQDYTEVLNSLCK